MPDFEIITPGPMSTVQDMGRTGCLAAGFCPNGVMDRYNAILANALAGNAEPNVPNNVDMKNIPASPALIEMTMQGVTGRFTSDTTFAVTGADMPCTLNDEPISAYKTQTAKAGGVLSVGYAKTGCRGYLAFYGGIDVPLVMGSRSTHVKCGIGGYNGRKLMRGDTLRIGASYKSDLGNASVAPLVYDKLFRVCEGPQFTRFGKLEIAQFLSSEYMVSPQSDRMGVRLDGALINCEGGSDIISDGICAGAIQISSSGQPMMLLADRQTVGGYAKPFVVIEADLPKAGQLRPGDTLRFAAVTPRKARMIMMEDMIHVSGSVRRVEDAITHSYRIMGWRLRTR
ncbi:MAG: biotin-dependent carboxyltransferase family protein [Oscillospiraceae bacterium]|jgi:biotin-dependent carboxylase-like uncharacterized protein|nr:biotin-dependent carboxyltransferase family protein [Oscillospiraceae bacterium]